MDKNENKYTDIVSGNNFYETYRDVSEETDKCCNKDKDDKNFAVFNDNDYPIKKMNFGKIKYV